MLVVLIVLQVTFYCIESSELQSDLDPMCLFGPGCSYSCHCDGTSYCNPQRGSCDSTCQGNPTGFHWGGPGCQVGNVAYGQRTWSNSDVDPGKDRMLWRQPDQWKSSSNAVDGNTNRNLFGGGCTKIRTLPANRQNPAWWMIDLGDFYRIYNVTIINNDEYFKDNLRNYRISYANHTNTVLSENFENVCAVIYTELEDNITVDCSHESNGYPIARYMAIINGHQRHPQNLEWFPIGMIICEFIVIGHKYIPVEWERCKDNPSNDIWCKNCDQWAPPDCKLFHPGYYGEMCRNTCPPYKYGYYCHKECNKTVAEDCSLNDDFCRFCQDISKCLKFQQCTTCQKWRFGDKCENHISMSKDIPQVRIVSVENTSVVVEITFDKLIKQELSQYYTYKIKYNSKGNESFAQKTIPHISYAKSITLELTGLNPNTSYEVNLEICRKYENWNEDCNQSKPKEFKLKRAISVNVTAISVNVTVIVICIVGVVVVILSALSAYCETKRRCITSHVKANPNAYEN